MDGTIGGRLKDSRRSTALAAAALPTAFLLDIETVDTFDRTESVDGGRFGTGGIFFGFALAVDVIDIVRFRPAVAFDVAVILEAVDAVELRLERGSVTSVLAVLYADVASLLLEMLDTGLDSVGDLDLIDLVSEAPLGVMGLVLRIVEATDGARDFGRSDIALLATLFLFDEFDGEGLTRGVCGDLVILEGPGETAEARDTVEGVRGVTLVGVRGVRDAVDITEAATEGGRCTGRRLVLVDAAVLTEVAEADDDTRTSCVVGTAKLAKLCPSSELTTLALMEDVMLSVSFSSRLDLDVTVARGLDTAGGVGRMRSSTGISSSALL